MQPIETRATETQATETQATDRGGANRLCLITGAANGLGRDLTRGLLADGWSVAGFDIDQAGLASLLAESADHGSRLTTQRVDVADQAAVSSAVAALAAARPLTALINNAGIISAGEVITMSPQDWDSVINVNLNGAFYVAQAAASAMVGAGGPGRIINIGSITGKSPRWGRVSYCVSKAAITMLTKSFALELAGHGITVNTVSPGSTVGGVVQKNIELGLSSVDRLTRGDAATFRLGVPTGRMATTDDVLGAVRYLLSPAAAQLTGVELRVDGGQGMF
jgi:2,3-dihydro-2,3-dihydroxybenzoate dehydrogenase